MNQNIVTPLVGVDNDLVDLSTGGSDSVEFNGAFFGDNGGSIPSGANYTEVLGFDPADDTIVLDPTDMFWLRTTIDTDVANGDDPLIFQYSSGTAVIATTDAFNFIKVIDPVNVGAGTAAFGFTQAMGGFGSIDIAAITPFAEYIAGSYFDATNTQAVLWNVTDANGDTFISAADALAGGFVVIGLVDMTQTQYAAFNEDNLSFTPFV